MVEFGGNCLGGSAYGTAVPDSLLLAVMQVELEKSSREEEEVGGGEKKNDVNCFSTTIQQLVLGPSAYLCSMFFHCRQALAVVTVAVHCTGIILFGQWNDGALLYYVDGVPCLNEDRCQTKDIIQFMDQNDEYRTLDILGLTVIILYIIEVVCLMAVFRRGFFYITNEDLREDRYPGWHPHPGLQIAHLFKVSLLIFGIVWNATGLNFRAGNVYVCLVLSPRLLDQLLCLPGTRKFFVTLSESFWLIFELALPFLIFLFIFQALLTLMFGAFITDNPYKGAKVQMELPCLWRQLVEDQSCVFGVDKAGTVVHPTPSGDMLPMKVGAFNAYQKDFGVIDANNISVTAQSKVHNQYMYQYGLVTVAAESIQNETGVPTTASADDVIDRMTCIQLGGMTEEGVITKDTTYQGGGGRLCAVQPVIHPCAPAVLQPS